MTRLKRTLDESFLQVDQLQVVEKMVRGNGGIGSLCSSTHHLLETK